MIHLEAVNENNWREDLAVSPEQAAFVSPLHRIFARAYAYREQRSRAFIVYEDELPVGAGLYYDCPELEAYVFSQLFIDRRYQRRGFGSAAAELVMEELRQDGRYNKAVLCYIEGNTEAKRLYERLGFTETDRDEDEIIMEAKW